MSYLYAAPGLGFDPFRVEPFDPNITIYTTMTQPIPATRLAAEAMAMVTCAQAVAALSPESRKRVAEWLLRECEREQEEVT